jgi:hypothetical protein
MGLPGAFYGSSSRSRTHSARALLLNFFIARLPVRASESHECVHSAELPTGDIGDVVTQHQPPPPPQNLVFLLLIPIHLSLNLINFGNNLNILD